jgi:hypothetical protein
MEDSIIYPRFYKCKTLAKFKELDTKCCVLLGLPNDEDTIDYANPIVDVDGKNWLIVNQDTSSLFSKKEIAEMIQYDEIVLPNNNIIN